LRPDVLLRGLGIGGLGEDQDLVFDGGLQLGEASVDGPRIAEDLDVLEGIGVQLARLKEGGQLVDDGSRLVLEV